MIYVDRVSWVLGNGKTSNADSPTTTYTTGVYTVTMTAYLDNGATASITKEMYITVGEGNNNNRSSNYVDNPISLHFGWEESHGFGWSENAGDAFIWPESQASIFQYETDGFVEKIVWDLFTRKPYVINTRASYHGDSIYTDRADSAGEGGTDIESTMIFPEMHGEREHYDITHLETNLRFRPVIGEDELDPTIDIDVTLLIGDREEAVSTRKDIDAEKEVNFYYQNNKQGNSKTNQIQLTTSSSRFQFMGFESYFRTNDRAKQPAKYTPDAISLFLNGPSVWLTRWDYSLERVTAVKDTDASLVYTTGPDGLTGSSVDVTTLSVNIPAATASYMFWSKDTLALDIYGVAVGGWILYYKNEAVAEGELEITYDTLYDYRVFTSVLTTEILDEYYNNFLNYVPR